MEKYKNKYRIPSARLQTWNYGANGFYFITICTHNHEHFFGKIVDTQIDASVDSHFIATQIGQLAQKLWYEIPEHFPFVKLDEFVVMPNHIHGIIIIDKPDANEWYDYNLDGTDTIYGKKGGITGNKNPMLHENLSQIIRWYKGRCSFEAKKINANFSWQTRFYDHIIRNYDSYLKIQNYIIENPVKWIEDKYNYIIST